MPLKRKLPSGPEWDSNPFFTARPQLLEPAGDEFSQFINLSPAAVSLSNPIDHLPSTSTWDLSPPPWHSPSLYASGETPTDGSQPTPNDNVPVKGEPFFEQQVELDPAPDEDGYFNFTPVSGNDPIPPTSLPSVATATAPARPKRQPKPPAPPPSTTTTTTTTTTHATRTRKRRTVLSQPAQEAKREHFLQRNKQAAQRCRQNKKMQVQGLQTRANTLAQRRADMQFLVGGLREEVLILRGLLRLCDGGKEGGCLVQGRGLGIGGGVDLVKSEEMAGGNEGEERREAEGIALDQLLFKIQDNDDDGDGDGDHPEEDEKPPDQQMTTAATIGGG